MERNEILPKVVNEIELLAGKEIVNHDQEIFGKHGVLDSLNVIHIILFIENHFGININPFELTLDTLGTVNKIVDFIESKLHE